MRRIFFGIFLTAIVLAASVAGIAAGSTAARADGMPFCIAGETAGEGSSIGNCLYLTFRQCQETVRDTGRTCVVNPGYAYNSGMGNNYGAMAYEPMESPRYYGPSLY